MGKIQKILEEEVRRIPQRLLTQLISNKLKEVGLADTPGLAEAMIEHVLGGRGEPFIWDDGKPSNALQRNVKLSFSNKDVDQLHESISRLKDNPKRKKIPFEVVCTL
ncbi:MAG: hypothetical protein HXY30_03365 [Pseudorhodoplanes sp.]|nr:hypothetical protein [Pseudorhodoplanes sp.]